MIHRQSLVPSEKVVTIVLASSMSVTIHATSQNILTLFILVNITTSHKDYKQINNYKHLGYFHTR